MDNLANGTIVDGAPALGADDLAARMATLPGWLVGAGGHAISREWRFRNFARAAELANLAA